MEFEEEILAATLISFLEDGQGIITYLDNSYYIIYKLGDTLKVVDDKDVVEELREEDIGSLISFTELPKYLV